MCNEARVLDGKRIGLLGKGGAGKSSVAVLLAGAMRRRGYPVCVLDADSTNIGLHSALGLDDAPATLLDYYGGMVFSGGSVTCPVDDPTPLADAELDLERLPRDYFRRNAEGVVLLSAGKIGDKGPGAGCDGPVSKIARDVRLREGEQNPVTLVDFKAGFEDSARGVVNGLDWAIVVVDPTTAALQMAFDLKEMVRQTRAGVHPATRHLENPELVEVAIRLFSDARVEDAVVVLNRVRDAEMQSRLTDKLAQGGLTPIGVIPEDPALTLSWLEAEPLTSTLREAADGIVGALEKTADQLVER